MNIDPGHVLATWDLGEDAFDFTYPELKSAGAFKHYLSLYAAAESELEQLETKAKQLATRSEWLYSCLEREAAKL